MTALALLGYISAALFVQLALAIALAIAKYRREARTEAANAAIENPENQAAAWRGTRDFRVVGREFEDIARSICSFYLEPVDSLPLPGFKAGQFITLSLQTRDTNNRAKTITRCYSLSDKPGSQNYRISVKRVPAPANQPGMSPGRASNHLHDHVVAGDIVAIRAPSGQFHIGAGSDEPAVLIAGGIGITPLLSMLLWCLEHQPTRTVHLYHGVRNSHEQPFKTLLESLAKQHAGLHVDIVYSTPLPDDEKGKDYQHAGHVDVDLLRRTLPHGQHQFYICGPAPMMEALVPGLAEWGVLPSNIHYEAFGPASIHATPITPEAALATPVEVTFQKTGRTLAWDGRDENLLEFAERNGIPVDAGCRAGSCGSCQTRLVSGTVKYRDKPEFEVAPGHCLLCVGRPDSTLVLQA